MFSYIKRHWPVYVVLFLIAIAMGLGAAYIVGAKGSTPRSTMSEEVEQEQRASRHIGSPVISTYSSFDAELSQVSQIAVPPAVNNAVRKEMMGALPVFGRSCGMAHF